MLTDSYPSHLPEPKLLVGGIKYESMTEYVGASGETLFSEDLLLFRLPPTDSTSQLQPLRS